MDSGVVWMGVLAVALTMTTWLSWRQKNEKRDVMFLGVTAAGFSAGTAAMWVL